MATSVTISGSTYTYTISNIQNTLTCTPSNRNSRYGAVYAKPTIKRNKSGEAFKRYFYFRFISTRVGEILSWHDVEYRAEFTKSGTTATVTEVNAGYVDQVMGDFADDLAYYGVKSRSGTLKIYASTGYVEDSWTYVTSTYTAVAGSGWSPTLGNITCSITQNETNDPDPNVFGYIVNFAKASWNLTSSYAGYWQYVGVDQAVGYISPNGTATLSADGVSASKTAKNQISAISLSSKLITAPSLTATAKLTNTLGGSATQKTSTITVQPYEKPTINTLSISRTSATRSQDSAVISVGWIIDALNKQSTVTTDIKTGAVTASWVSVDLQYPDTEYASGSFDIISDGDSVTTLADQADEIATDANRTRAHDTYDSNHTYRFTVTLTDRLGQSSEPIPAILNSKFFLISARAGGKGIGFGMAPLNEGFHVNMPATFYDDIETEGDITAGGDVTDGTGNVLSNKQDKYEEDTWHDLSLASGLTSRGQNCYRKINGFVEVYIAFSVSGTHTSLTNAITTALPVGYRPKGTIQMCNGANTTTAVVAQLINSGMIQYYTAGNTSAWIQGYAFFMPA